MIKYSIIIPHYDDTERLVRLLRTIPVWRNDVEVIVVDDCSPDRDSVNLIRFDWPKVRWVFASENRGAGAARNIGLKNASGLYVIFADSDDEFLSDAFDVFDRNVGTEDLVYFLAEAVQEADGNRSNRAEHMNALCRAYAESPSQARLIRLKVGHVNPVAKLYARSFIENLNLQFEETRFGNDVAFNVMAAVQARKVSVILVPVYRIYRRAQSLTSNTDGKAFLERVQAQVRLASALKKLGIECRPSATGWMMSALFYGPRVTYHAWRMCIGSDMQLEWKRLFQVSRWTKFWRRWRGSRKEQQRHSSPS